MDPSPQPPRLQAWHLAAALVLCCSVVLGAVYWLRWNPGRTPAQLAGYLPLQGATVIYIDVAALRGSGILNLLSGSPATEDSDYKNFVAQTHFDYRNDLDALAASIHGADRLFVLRGRFDWAALINYVNKQGGACGRSFCQLGGSNPQRNISFYPLSPSLMALAVSPDGNAAHRIVPPAANGALAIPDKPVWMSVPASDLFSSGLIPDQARPFTSAFGGAEEVLFTMDGSDRDMKLAVNVRCTNPGAATVLLSQLKEAETALREGLKRQPVPPGPADVAGILASGSFRQDSDRVIGQWPIPQEFLAAVASGNAK